MPAPKRLNRSKPNTRPRPFLKDAKADNVTLANFHLDDLAPFKKEQEFDKGDSNDFRVFYVGRDDVHGCMKYLLSRTARSLYMNMFGYDDDELNAIIQHLVTDEHVYVQGSLDKSQAGGVHEKKILATWNTEMAASFAIGTSATRQISHTKGGVCDGKVGWEGSTNWSGSGEGTIVDPAGTDKGRKSQNNTLLVYTNPIEVANFVRELNEEHTTMLQQLAAKGVGPATAARKRSRR